MTLPSSRRYLSSSEKSRPIAMSRLRPLGEPAIPRQHAEGTTPQSVMVPYLRRSERETMEKIWKKHWPAGLDEPTIHLPTTPLTFFLKENARRAPDKPAIIFYGREISFAELDQATDRFAGWLRQRGLKPGDRVAIFLENYPQFAIAYFGALKARSINVCLNPMHKATELLHEFDDSGARGLVPSDQGYAVVEPVRAKTEI